MSVIPINPSRCRGPIQVGSTASTDSGLISSSRKPGRVPLATLSTFRRSSWLVVSSGLRRNSKNLAWNSATAKGIAHEEPPPAVEAQDHSDQFLNRVHSRTGKLIGAPHSLGIDQHAGNGLRDILYKYRLKTCLTAANERQHWHQPGERSELVEQRVTWTKHGTRADDDCTWKCLSGEQFATSPCANVRGS
jgi:hypothetical protein